MTKAHPTRLFDRLQGRDAEPIEHSVGRDLQRLFDERIPLALTELRDRDELTVLEFGLPDPSTVTRGDGVAKALYERLVARIVTRFEPCLSKVEAELIASEHGGSWAALEVRGRLRGPEGGLRPFTHRLWTA